MDKIVLNISEQEKEEIITVLDDCLSDVNMELADTDSMDYRLKLKNRQKLIQKVIDSLKRSGIHAVS